jgi:hypothetical protein
MSQRIVGRLLELQDEGRGRLRRMNDADEGDTVPSERLTLADRPF